MLLCGPTPFFFLNLARSAFHPTLHYQQLLSALGSSKIDVWVRDSVFATAAIWMQQQARNFSLLVAENRNQPSYLIHDRDGAFFPLDQVLRPAGIKPIRTPPQSPMYNAYAERFVREARETLDNLILLGERHLRHVLKQIVHHHNQQRPHQGLGNVIPLVFEYPDRSAIPTTVRCDANLGGL